MYSQVMNDLPLIGRATQGTLVLLDMPSKLIPQLAEIGLEGRALIDTYSPSAQSSRINELKRTERVLDEKRHYFPAYVLGTVQDIDLNKTKLAFTREQVKDDSHLRPFFQSLQTVNLEEIIDLNPLARKESVERTA
ncbi:hypothetical protein HYY70_01080 [Candidatus Woesearchaeota archaeon]|nr:hypothetical protein [Candidatus Woesearchaeota archaeon]